MKKIFFFAVALFLFNASWAQVELANFSASVSGNYTMYKGTFNQKTPGGKLELGYNFSDQARIGLAYTHHLPIKIASVISSSDGSSTVETPSDLKFNFSTISLAGNYTFVNTDEDPFSIYGIVGISLVAVKFKEEPRTALPAGTTYTDAAAPGKESGLAINLGLGLQYKAGPVRLFADANAGLPSNNVNSYFYENPIPLHLVFNAGVRIPFGSREY